MDANNPAITSSNKILKDVLDLSTMLMGHGFKISKKRKSKKDNKINIQKLILSNFNPLTNNIGDKLMSCPKNSSIIISDGSCTLFFNT